MKTIHHTARIQTAILTAILTLSLITTSILTTPHKALAATDTYPAPWAPPTAQDSMLDSWRELNRECTSYASWMLHSANGFEIPFYDYATNWGSRATALGYTVNSIPAVGSIYWKLGTPTNQNGHVAWVESVSADGSTVNYLDYNAAFTGLWAEHTGVATNSASGYIHFKDLTPGLGGGNASSWASGRFDAWIKQATPTNGSNLGHIWFNGAWQPWETIGAPNNELMASQPAAVSWSYGTTPNRIDVFAQGQANDLIQTYYDGTSWHQWYSQGGCISGTPTVTSWGVGRLDIFAKACTASNGSNLVHIWYDSSGWHPWEYIAENQLITSTPSAVAWGSGRIDIFAAGTSSALIHAWYDVTTGGWHSFENLGGCIVGAPAASSWGTGRIDAWVEGCNTTGGNFYQTWWSAPTGWSAFNSLSPTYQISGVLGAVSWGPNRIDMFTRASNNTLDHWWFDGTSFNGPENKGGSIAS